MSNYIHKSEYFNGNKISSYGLQHGYIDYYTLARSYSYVLNNDIIGKTQNIGWWEVVNGSDVYYYNNETGECIEYDDIKSWDTIEECYIDVYQYYIISDNFARDLMRMTDQIIFYNEELDMYVWGVTHWGTSWDYVLTDIKIELNKKELE